MTRLDYIDLSIALVLVFLSWFAIAVLLIPPSVPLLATCVFSFVYGMLGTHVLLPCVTRAREYLQNRK